MTDCVRISLGSLLRQLDVSVCRHGARLTVLTNRLNREVRHKSQRKAPKENRNLNLALHCISIQPDLLTPHAPKQNTRDPYGLQSLTGVLLQRQFVQDRFDASGDMPQSGGLTEQSKPGMRDSMPCGDMTLLTRPVSNSKAEASAEPPVSAGFLCVGIYHVYIYTHVGMCMCINIGLYIYMDVYIYLY